MTFVEVQDAVAADAGISSAALLGDGRSQRLANTRAVAIYLCRRLLDMSFPELGRSFNRDHTSCWAAFEKVRASSRLLDRAVTLRMQLEAPLPRADHADPEEVMA